MYEINNKTIFVLDHTQYFSISSAEYIPLDYLKGKTNNAVELVSATAGRTANAQFSKSLWTCSVEASIEYCRIVWDLFLRDKLVRFIVSDTAAHIVNTWNHSTQNMSHVLNAMALVGVPHRNMPQSSDYSVIHGMRAAIEALAEPTDDSVNVIKMPNKGRVICITSTRDNASIKSLEEIFHTVLLQQNTLSAAAGNIKKMLHIDHCHLVIINVVPLNVKSLVTNRGILELSPILSTEIHNSKAPEISNKLTHLIMSHYDLASTTVTGIPMKEEQNANSSANYDVEILHARNAHTAVCGNEALLPTSIKDGSEYETVTLKWCTPRGCGSSDMLPCVARHRVTPVDVTSRPSACLINFLLNGRSVLLEMPRKTGGKTTSHLLSARGGEIFIHALQITRSSHDEFPSITEGFGGRVSDYRYAEYAALIKQHRFLPLKHATKTEENLVKARERICRRSRYFPLNLGSSLIYSLHRNVNLLAQLVRRITKEDMDKADESQCQQYIYELYAMASRGDPLPIPNMSGGRLRGHKKVEQYKLLCAELELMIRNYANTPHHKVILESVQNVRAACGDSINKTESDASRDSTGKSYSSSTTTDSPMSPTHSIDSAGSSSGLIKSNKRAHTSNGQRTLLDFVSSVERSQSAKRVEFSGRMCTPLGQVAKLYPDFGLKEKESTAAGAPTTKEDAIKLELGIRT